MPCATHMYVFVHGQAVYAQLQTQLQTHVASFINYITHHGLFQKVRYQADYPIFAVQENELYEYLKQQGILISQFAYPSLDDVPTTRIVLRACHCTEDIAELSQALSSFYQT